MYESIAHLPQVPLQNVLLDGYDLSGTPGFEAGSDIEFAIAMAPGLAKVVIFDAGPNGNWNDVINSIAANPQVKQVSSSWHLQFFRRLHYRANRSSPQVAISTRRTAVLASTSFGRSTIRTSRVWAALP
jgi:hypothetical protein